jgi:heme-degrading monooxygenase HmoA
MHEHAVDPAERLPCSGDQIGIGRPRDHGHQEAMMSDTVPNQPAIARIWRGRTRRDRADAYEAYNHEAGIKPLIEKALAVQTFREDRELETEFMTISYWESIEAMRRFTGSDPTRIHHLERDEEFLIELPREVQVLRLRKSHGLAYARQEES